MGQIRGKKPHISACNIRSLSSFGTPYAGMHILVSTDNSATEDGQGNFDAYVVGDGVKAATALPLKEIVENTIYKQVEVSTTKTNFINSSLGKWQAKFDGYWGVIQPLEEGKKYKISTGNNGLAIAILESNTTTPNTLPDYSSAHPARIVLAENSEYIFSADSESKYLFIHVMVNSVSKVFTLSEGVSLKEVLTDVVDNYVSTESQSFSDLQMKQARANLGLGDGTIDGAPTTGSGNVVTSGGVKKTLTDSEIAIINSLSNGAEVSESAFVVVGKYIVQSNPNSFVGITGGGRYKSVGKGERYLIKAKDSFIAAYAFLSSIYPTDSVPSYIDGETVHRINKGEYVIVEIPEDCDLFLNYSDGTYNHFPSIYKIEDAFAFASEAISASVVDNNILFGEKFHVAARTAFTKTSTRSDYLKGRTLYFGYYTENRDSETNINTVPSCYIVGVKKDGTKTTLLTPYYPLRSVTPVTLDSDYDSIKIKCDYTDNGCDVLLYIWSEYDNNTLYVAASDAPTAFKNKAHFICDGVNDETELNAAAALTYARGTLKLSQGQFYIDNIPLRGSLYGAIVKEIPLGSVGNSCLNIIGDNKYFRSESPKRGTRIFVRDSAFENVPSGTECYVITPTILKNTGRFKITDLNIRIESNNHKVVAINGQSLGAMIIDSLSVSAADNAWSETPPPAGSVGIRGIMGDCNGSDYVLKNTYCIGFHEGFQLGGEHLVAYELGTRFCYYGYTFGNYDYGSWYDQESEIVTDTHPLTLINCCDEGSRALPKFVKSGVYRLSDQAAKQAINLINFNFEINQSPLPAEEVTSGAFCGIIDFVAYGSTNTSKNTTTGTRYNRVDIKFWKDGSGKYFKTTNDAHAESGTTEERLGYWAQPNQQYYDTDLNKMLICTDSEAQEWRDFNGNIINSQSN